MNMTQKFAVLIAFIFNIFHLYADNTSQQIEVINEIAAEDYTISTTKPSEKKLPYKGFFLLTIPKSGTGLAVKLLSSLTNSEGYIYGIGNLNMSYEEFELFLINCNRNKKFAYSHVYDPLIEYYRNFIKHDFDYLNILQIRDIRDIIISAVFFFEVYFKEINIYNLDEKLDYLLNLAQNQKITGNFDLLIYMNANIKDAIEWKNNINAFVLKFEDIVGTKGGGNYYIQLKTILSLASALNIQLSEDKLNWIIENLHGIENGLSINHVTFRSGQIGEWKKYFKPYQARLFNENWGEYQLALGYPLITEEEIIALEQNYQEENIDLEQSCPSDNN